MATPHHLARSRRRSGDGIRSARCSIAPGSSDPRLPTPFTTCTPQPAPCCVAEPQERVCPQPLCSWRASESRAARQHGTHTARSSAFQHASRVHVPRSPPARPLARRTLRRTHQTHTPRMSLPHAAAHADAAIPAARPAHASRNPLVTKGPLLPPSTGRVPCWCPGRARPITILPARTLSQVCTEVR